MAPLLLLLALVLEEILAVGLDRELLVVMLA